MICEHDANKDKNTMLNEHISVWEMRSHYNGTLTTNKVLSSSELMEKVDQLFDKLGADICLVSSGYRNLKCDKLVGGTGAGEHTKGTAVDICFKKNGKPIDTKIVSCYAQDLGFNGIARISNSYIHLDVRAKGKYYGDEMIGSTNSVTNDFYKYFNIKKENDRDKVKEKFGLAEETMKFLDTYKYSNDLYKKLLK